MNTLEDRYIASAMRSIGRTPEAPADGVQQIVTRAKRRNTIGRVVSTAGAVVSVTLVVAGAAAVVQVNDAEESVVSTSTASPAPTGWQQLTGKELGEALGWTAAPTGSIDCDDLFAEYVDGMGFCIKVADLEAAGLPTTRIDQLMLAYQITGRERSPELREYVQLQEELKLGRTDYDRIQEIMDRLRVLEPKIKR